MNRTRLFLLVIVSLVMLLTLLFRQSFISDENEISLVLQGFNKTQSSCEVNFGSKIVSKKSQDGNFSFSFDEFNIDPRNRRAVVVFKDSVGSILWEGVVRFPPYRHTIDLSDPSGIGDREREIREKAVELLTQ